MADPQKPIPYIESKAHKDNEALAQKLIDFEVSELLKTMPAVDIIWAVTHAMVKVVGISVVDKSPHEAVSAIGELVGFLPAGIMESYYKARDLKKKAAEQKK